VEHSHAHGKKSSSKRKGKPHRRQSKQLPSDTEGSSEASADNDIKSSSKRNGLSHRSRAKHALSDDGDSVESSADSDIKQSSKFSSKTVLTTSSASNGKITSQTKASSTKKRRILPWLRDNQPSQQVKLSSTKTADVPSDVSHVPLGSGSHSRQKRLMEHVPSKLERPNRSRHETGHYAFAYPTIDDESDFTLKGDICKESESSGEQELLGGRSHQTRASLLVRANFVHLRHEWSFLYV
jgi:hypothetical protein